MRKSKTVFVIMLTLLVCMFAACSNGEVTPTPTPTTAPAETPEATPTETPATEPKVITIEEALKLCGEPGNITEERYYIRGTVERMIDAAYGNMIVIDEPGSITVYGT